MFSLKIYLKRQFIPVVAKLNFQQPLAPVFSVTRYLKKKSNMLIKKHLVLLLSALNTVMTFFFFFVVTVVHAFCLGIV